jgi:5'-nucleotidase/UDP-sugar diphosphatase
MKMKRLMTIIGIVAAVSMYSLAQAQIDTLTILHLNDTHSHLLPYGPKDAEGNWTWGGMARIATIIGTNRMTESNVMLLHAGDIFVGDFMFQKYLGIAELEIMKGLGYDAMAVGNHEFDLYPSTLKYVLNEAGFPGEGFPILCANLDISGDPELGYFVRPYIIKEYGDLKVGIFSLLTDLTNQIANPSPVVVLPPLSVAQDWVDSLRMGHGCDLVILLSHLGIDYEQLVASSVSGIDIIVGGHSHTALESPLQIGNTLLLQAGEFGKYVGKLRIMIDGEASMKCIESTEYIDNNPVFPVSIQVGIIQSWDYELLPVDSSVPEEPTIAAIVNNLAAGVEADPRFGPVYTDVIAQASTQLDKPLGQGLCKDNAMGNLISDAFRDLTGTDIAIQPQGFISQTIYQGDVKGADIFQAVPYGFDEVSGLGLKLMTFETDGMSLISGLEFSVYNLPSVEDFFLHGSNFSYVYDLTNPPGSRVDYSTVSIGGEPLDPYATYSVTVPDAVVPFLSQIPGFQVNNLQQTGFFVYQVVRDFVTANSPVAYWAEGRVIDLSLLEEPLVGVMALSDVVELFRKNGSIHPRYVADRLKRHLRQTQRHLEHGRDRAAVRSLEFFKIRVRFLARWGCISSWSSEKLIYLTDKLIRSIGVPFAKSPQTEISESLPQAFELHQNYPNPFNPETQISFSLPEDGEVRLTIYNVLGQRVKVLLDEYQRAGTQTVVWDGRNEKGEEVSSGIYFYKLQVGEFVQTKKMSLMK